jgi:antirestriction protein ArdC/phage/plasmid primase-like uncharacterized protein
MKHMYKMSDGTTLSYQQILERYFEPGAIRPAFGGQDRILAYDPARYTVTAQAVDEDGRPLGGARAHRTLPTPGSRQLNEFLRQQGLEPLNERESRIFRTQVGISAARDSESRRHDLRQPGAQGSAIGEEASPKARDYRTSDGTTLSYDEVLERYFAPGSIRPAFGGQDRVLSFDLARYRVTAQAVDKDGNPLLGIEGRIRSHGTLPAPGSRDLNDFLRAEGLEPLHEPERLVFRRQHDLTPEAPERDRAPSSLLATPATAPGDEKMPMRAEASDYAREVASVIIDQLRRGTAPWTKPWEPGQVPSHPMNPITGKDYRGGNALWLMVQGNLRGYSDPRWMTFRQALGEGACVRKGEKGTRIQYWMWSGDEPVRDEKTGQPKTDEKGEAITQRVQYERPRVFTAVVFNAEQIDGLPPLEKKTGPTEWERHQRAEGILSASGANIVHAGGDRAYYNVLRDQVVLPEREQFKTGDGYYATALHELAHWTGAASRLDRDLTGTFGSEDYAREELRAEIASFMVGTRVGVGHDPASHASYVANWIKALEEDPREVFRAAADAEKIADFVQQFDRTVEKPAADQVSVAPVLAEGTRADAMDAVSPKEATAMAAEQRTNLVVPYAERSEARAAGARWDRTARVWFAPKGIDLGPVARWMPSEKNQSEQKPAAEVAGDKKEAGERTYLAVPYREKNEARQLGAQWDKGCKAWFVPPGISIEPFAKWMPKAHEVVTDPFAEFDQAVRKAGLKLPDGERPLLDGQWHRVPVEGDKPGEKSGAYRGYSDGRPAGFIENHKAGTRANWKSQQPMPVLTEAEKATLAAETALRRVERAAARERGYEAVATACKARWQKAVAPSDGRGHPYLEKKEVPAFGVRVDKAGQLLVPLHDTASGRLVSLQSIGADGRKSFEKGGRVAGASFCIDPAQFAVRLAKDGLRFGPISAPPGANKTLVIAEGYATAATVARAIGLPTYVAFNASNLVHVAKELRRQHPEATICIAGDNDHRAPSEGRANVGRVKAEAAAKAVAGHVLLPEFSPKAKGSDWNDLEKAAGREAVRSALEEGMAAAILLEQARRDTLRTAVKDAPAAERRNHAPTTELPPEMDFTKYGSWDGR